MLSFTLTNLSSGIYSCKATSKGFSPIISETSVILRGPPQILQGREVQFGAVGDTVHVICEAKAVPRVKEFFWQHKGQEMRQEATSFSIVETQHGNIIRSTLIIQKVSENNFGEYGCRVKNVIGEVSTVIELKAVGKQLNYFGLFYINLINYRRPSLVNIGCRSYWWPTTDNSTYSDRPYMQKSCQNSS